jgi:Uncharacterized protein conserved in bacteria
LAIACDGQRARRRDRDRRWRQRAFAPSRRGRQERPPDPLLNSKITIIRFFPYWTVPKSIILKDLIPQMQKDSGYLDRQKIHVFDPRSGTEVSWQTIDWRTEQAVNYMFRQEPGDLNSMGTVKIDFPSPEGVYMHDTPSKGLFGGNDRFHFLGLHRVQNVREYVYWILKNTPTGRRIASPRR